MGKGRCTRRVAGRGTSVAAFGRCSLETRAGRLLVSLSPLSSQAADPLRTRWPGPELGQHAFTRARLLRTALRRRVLTVALHGNAFGDGPYAVRTRSSLVLTLRRMSVKTVVFPVPSPPS